MKLKCNSKVCQISEKDCLHKVKHEEYNKSCRDYCIKDTTAKCEGINENE